MKWKTLAVLVALMALAGCGGGDDDDSSADSGADAPAADTSTAPDAPAPEPIEGKVTEAKLIAAAGLEKKGAGYTWSDGCDVKAVAAGKANVKKLQESADDVKKVIPNKSATAAIEIVQATYPCAVHASLILRGVP